jgi:murein DD-endopeptidase MepM/ murein hydrolase activator NlpD
MTRYFWFAGALLLAGAIVTAPASRACDAKNLPAGPEAGIDDAPRFIWPVHGMPVADLCSDGSERRSGLIEIAVREGTPVKAAADGVVAYAGGEMKSYGNLVILVHNDGWATAYGYAKSLLVKRGDQVRQGETVALSGHSPVTDIPLLHFEIRKTGHAVDAFKLLSERRGG